MKKILMSLLAMMMVTVMYAKNIQELVVTTNPPMHCENCENKIKKGDLRFLKGVQKIETNVADQRVTVVYDADKTNPEKIEEAFKKTGYSVEIINTDAKEAKAEAPAEKSCCGNCGNQKSE